MLRQVWSEHDVGSRLMNMALNFASDMLITYEEL